MNFESIASLAIVGAAVSAIVQAVKARFTPTGTRLFVVLLSLAAASLYWFVRDTGFWTSFLSILALANTVYLFLIRPFFGE